VRVTERLELRRQAWGQLVMGCGHNGQSRQASTTHAALGSAVSASIWHVLDYVSRIAFHIGTCGEAMVINEPPMTTQ